MQCLEYLNKSQWWSTHTLKDLQEKKLKQIIKIAYHDIPYYKEQLKQQYGRIGIALSIIILSQAAESILTQVGQPECQCIFC